MIALVRKAGGILEGDPWPISKTPARCSRTEMNEFPYAHVEPGQVHPSTANLPDTPNIK